MNDFRASAAWAALMRSMRWLGFMLPSSIYSHLWFHGEFLAHVHGFRFRMRHTGSELENQVFWCNTFEQERGTTAIAVELLSEVDGFIDIGANTGFFSLLAKAIRPNLPVLAVEASPANAELLRRNVELNGFEIEIVEAAATSVDGDVVLYDFEGSSYSASLQPEWRKATFQRQIRGLRLDTLLKHARATRGNLLIKIDVEGHELGVLEGATSVTGNNSAFLIEVIRDYVAAGIRKFLPPQQFRYRLINEHDRSLTDLTATLAKGSEVPFGNYLVTPTRWGVRFRH